MGLFAVVWLGAAYGGAYAGAEPLTVKVQPASVQTRYFDPAAPPKQMPPLKPGEAAVTESDFSVQAQMQVTILRQRIDAETGRCTATIRVDSVTVTTGLAITIWLPRGAADKLRAHEEGHQRISERFYRDAKAIAQRLARPRIGQTLTGQGADVHQAAQAAMSQSMDKLNGDWMKQISLAAQAVQERYDTLTDHGRNDLDEDQAIDKAMAKGNSPQGRKGHEAGP
jgi:hypothetical protein